MTVPSGLERQPRWVVTPVLGRWAGAWDELLNASPLPSPFLRSWWLQAVASGEPCFPLVFDGGELIGGVALEQRRRLGTTFVGTLGSGPLCPDHLDMLAAPGHETDVDDMIQAWLARDGSRVIQLDGVSEVSRLPKLLPPPVQVRSNAVAPSTTLDPSLDFLARRSRNLRSNIRKAERRFDDVGAVYRLVPPFDVEDALRNLRRLHVAQWGRSRFLSAFDQFAAASRAGVRVGELTFHELVVGERPIASVVCFEVARRVSFYQGGRELDRRWRSAGTLLLYHVIKDALERGFLEFDLLRGDEPYKANFATEERKLLSVQAGNGLRGRLLLAGIEAVHRARKTASVARRKLRRV